LGTILRWDGVSWRDVESPANAGCTGACTLTCVWGSGPNEVWAAGSSHLDNYNEQPVLRWDGARWSVVSTPAAVYGNWRACGRGSDNGVWLAGDYGSLARWGGSAWAYETILAPDLSGELGPYFRGSVNGLWGSSEGDVWAVGGGVDGAGLISRWDGRSWGLSFTFGKGLNAVWGLAPDDVWSVGAEHAILRWNGHEWVNHLDLVGGSIERDTELNAIWGSGANDLWAVGSRGYVVHFDGQRWSAAAADTNRHLRGIWGASAGDVWAVGDNGTILRWHP
jgi:hypothetical protein